MEGLALLHILWDKSMTLEGNKRRIENIVIEELSECDLWRYRSPIKGANGV